MTNASAKADNLITAVITGRLLDVDSHPNSRTLMEHKAFLSTWCRKFMHFGEAVAPSPPLPRGATARSTRSISFSAVSRPVMRGNRSASNGALSACAGMPTNVCQWDDLSFMVCFQVVLHSTVQSTPHTLLHVSTFESSERAKHAFALAQKL